jgi:E3 ubiquitin-protein ligase UHRF1
VDLQLRTAPQSKDQDFENPFNHALKVPTLSYCCVCARPLSARVQVSAETKKPVRVIRGFKCKSKYAPAEGYRYDGLYVVEKAWRAPGLNEKGFLVCKYIFKVRAAGAAGGGKEADAVVSAVAGAASVGGPG